MFKLRNEKKNKELNTRKLKDKLDNLKNKIPEIRHLETGINLSASPSAYDLVLITEFTTMNDLDTYRINPYHQELISYLETIKDKAVVVDYEI
ncbi:hypothetical protein ES703_118016 [subsurface metagenome]